VRCDVVPDAAYVKLWPERRLWNTRGKMTGDSRSVKCLLIILIRIYQRMLSPLLGDCCRFYPSCSNYCLQAVERYGCLKGVWMGLLRVCRCHPYHPGGVDLVPGSVHNHSES
jgi:uncharacterized protein